MSLSPLAGFIALQVSFGEKKFNSSVKLLVLFAPVSKWDEVVDMSGMWHELQTIKVREIIIVRSPSISDVSDTVLYYTVLMISVM